MFNFHKEVQEVAALVLGLGSAGLFQLGALVVDDFQGELAQRLAAPFRHLLRAIQKFRNLPKRVAGALGAKNVVFVESLRKRDVVQGVLAVDNRAFAGKVPEVVSGSKFDERIHRRSKKKVLDIDKNGRVGLRGSVDGVEVGAKMARVVGENRSIRVAERTNVENVGCDLALHLPGVAVGAKDAVAEKLVEYLLVVPAFDEVVPIEVSRTSACIIQGPHSNLLSPTGP